MAPHMSPALAEATNALPVAGAYAPFPAHEPITALPSAAKGYFSGILPDGTPIVYSATRSAIYRVTGAAATSAYDASPFAGDRWWFAQVGGKLCAGAAELPPVGASLGGAFSPLGGSPPAAAVGAVVNRDYLVLGNLTGEPVDGTVPNRVRWSGQLNPDSWGTSIETGADYEDMHDDGGPVVQITGRSVGTVFQRRAITRMQLTGSAATVFAFTTVELGRGAVTAGGVCDVGALVFYRADDGFFAWDGTQSMPIGNGRVDDWFERNADSSKIDLMRSGYDPVNRCIMWAFPEVGQTANSAILVYSLADQKFTLVRSAMEEIGYSATLPASIETMPVPDDASLSWDDGAYAGKRPILGGIDTNHTYGTFTGEALAATFVTGDMQSAPGQRVFCSAVRPLIDAPTAKVAVGEREQASKDVIAWNPATALGVDGTCPQRADARLMRFRATTDAGDIWTRASGVEAEIIAAGRR